MAVTRLSLTRHNTVGVVQTGCGLGVVRFGARAIKEQPGFAGCSRRGSWTAEPNTRKVGLQDPVVVSDR
jgi:hypothetical protein